MMIEIKKIEPPKVDLYAPDGTHLGLLNQYEFVHARVQINKAKATGYYAMFNGQKIRIDKNGILNQMPIGMFDQLTDMYLELI